MDFGSGVLLAAAPLFAASSFYLLDLFRLTLFLPGLAWLSFALALLPAISAWRRSGAPHFDVVSWIVVLALAALFVFQLRDTFILPAHDHLTPLAVGRAIAETGTFLHRPYSEGALLVSYPPGLGLLVAPLFALVGDVPTIGFYTWIAATTIGLVPLAWAFALKRLYLPEAPLWPLAVAMAIGFFLLDRSLMSAAIYAGKNSFLAAALLLPLALVLVIEGIGDWRREALAVLAALGVVLVHFSMAYMLACFLGAWLLIERPQATVWIRMAAIGAIVLAAFLPLALMADRNSMMLVTTAPEANFWRFFSGLVTERTNDVLFAYNRSDKLKIAPWPWKGIALIASVGALALMAWATSRQRHSLAGYAVPLARASGVFLVAGLMMIVLGSGLIPRAGIEKVYASWCLIFFMAPIFAAAILGLWSTTKLSLRVPMGLLAGSAALVFAVGAGGMAFVDDYLKARRYVLRQASSLADISNVRDRLDRISMSGPCYLITSSSPIDFAVTMQGVIQVSHGARLLDHVPLISHCRVMTGSFTTAHVAGGRDNRGYPSLDAIARLPDHARIVFVGSEGELSRYLRSVPTLEIRERLTDFGSLAAAELIRN